jgi:hypothetical protein
MDTDSDGNRLWNRKIRKPRRRGRGVSSQTVDSCSSLASYCLPHLHFLLHFLVAFLYNRNVDFETMVLCEMNGRPRAVT